MFILGGVKDNLLVARIFGHGDDLRSIKKLILIILITHVSFARAALICKEKAALFTLAQFTKTWPSRILTTLTTNTATQGREQGQSQK